MYSKSASTPMTWARSSVVAAGPLGRCGPLSAPLPGTGTSASTSWRPARSGNPVQVTVGRIGRPHGVRGDVVVGVRTDEPELRFAKGSRLGTDPVALGPLTVAATKWHSGELLVRFEGIGDRDAAADLRGTWLLVDSSTLAPP